MYSLYRKTAAFLTVLLLALSLVLCNAVQMITLLLWPISGSLFRKANSFIAGIWYGFLVFLCEQVLRIQFVQTGDTLPREENVFLLSNHQAMADIPALLVVANRINRAKDAKWYVKDPLKWVPGIGWGMLFLDCIFVKRNWTADKSRILKTFENLRNHRVPFWVISFLEGTRATPEKIARSQAYGKKAALPHFEHVLLPRTKGFEATLEGLGDVTHAVYDATIGYVGKPPSLMELFFSTKEVHIHMRRFPLSSLPTTNAERGKWALERFQEKEAWLAEFKRRH